MFFDVKQGVMTPERHLAVPGAHYTFFISTIFVNAILYTETDAPT